MALTTGSRWLRRLPGARRLVDDSEFESSASVWELGSTLREMDTGGEGRPRLTAREPLTWVAWLRRFGPLARPARPSAAR